MLYLLTALLAASVSPPPQTHICWIKQVHATRDGVSIEFSGGHGGARKRGEVYYRFIVDRDPDNKIVSTGLENHVRAVDAVVGDEIQIYGSPEDGCTISVEKINGVLGVNAVAYMHMPGLPPQSAHEFISALKFNAADE